MAAANNVLPSATEMATLTDLPAVVRWAGMDTAFWDTVNASFGRFPTFRLLAQAPPDMVSEGIETLCIAKLDAAGNALDPPEERALTMLEQVQVALIWRMVRATYNMEDIDILAPGALASYLASKSGTPIATGSNMIPLPPGGIKIGIQKVKVS